jgi:ubiquinone/menaquinone biosynthesis C-methylase UbiE
MKNISNKLKILENFVIDSDNIYGNITINSAQEVEHKLRENVANAQYLNYLAEIAKHHSIVVMDHEIKQFCQDVNSNGVIVDVGGCWGWHWRNIHLMRPDLTIVIVDLVKSNLRHANKLLGDRIGKNIFLVHGDATDLQFPESYFDGYWSVQTLQHIPNFQGAIQEACRTLKTGGKFASYSLNNAIFIKMMYKFLGKDYITKGFLQNQYFIQRADKEQREKIAEIFSNIVVERFTEILFKPEFHLGGFGEKNSLIGKLDSILGGNFHPLKSIARQHSFHTYKK